MMVWHKTLKQRFAGRGSLKVSYSGGLWGLGCNSIHFIDLLSWWSGEIPVSIETSNLDTPWISSKREGYFEVTGLLVVRYSRGSTLSLYSNPITQATPLKVELADGICWWVDEIGGLATSSYGERIAGQLEYQSTMTPRLVDDILQQGHCDLPTINESAAMHAIFLDAMLKHWNYSQHRNDLRVPIT
jgi:hypothetical protein